MRTDDPVGKRFRYGPDGTPVEVVGMVETGKYYALNEDPRPTVFLPIFQSYTSSTTIVARSSISEAAAAAAIGDAVQALDARLPFSVRQSAAGAIALTFLPSQVAVVALGVFGVLAIVLAITGVYGLAASSVSARVRELGIRIAIGASRVQLLRSVLGRTALLLAAGSIVGIVLGTAAQGVLGAVVYQASSRDPLLVVAVIAAMFAAGLGAAWMPARRALSIDPAQTLRS
jgi:ABC-type antimicrobial peptide transport system permease subunit